jgi:hypothetical protein
MLMEEIYMNNGCIVSHRILKDGYNVGYMYREYPSLNFPDSGWRFFEGSEDETYNDNPDNFSIVCLETVISMDKSIKSYLNNNVGVAFLKKDGIFMKEILSNNK